MLCLLTNQVLKAMHMHVVCYIYPHVGGYECAVYGIPQILCHGNILRIEFSLLGFGEKRDHRRGD